MGRSRTHLKSKVLKIIFFGTPDYVFPVLDALHTNFQLVAVVTQEPKQAGRKMEKVASPVESWAKTHGVPVIYNFTSQKLPTADVAVVASFGIIIPVKTIDHFQGRIINIHPSLLPKYRGASPVQAAILSGENETGVTFIQMDEKLDHGPIAQQITEPILPTDTLQTLRARLFQLSAHEVSPLVHRTAEGKLKVTQQDHKCATFTRTIKKEDSYIDPKYIKAAITAKSQSESISFSFLKETSFALTPELIERLVRSMNPWPLVWTHITIGTSKKRLMILQAHVSEGKLLLDQVQLEGKNPVLWKQFTEGYPKARF